MTANEFAEKINTPYPTVAQWLRDGRIPGALLQEVGKVRFWLIPVDVLKDFARPKKGRPKKAVKKISAKKRSKKKGGTAK